MTQGDFHTGHGRHQWNDGNGNDWSPESLTDFCWLCDCTPDCPAHAEAQAAERRVAELEMLVRRLAEAYHSANEIENPEHRGAQVFDRLHESIPQCQDYHCAAARQALADTEAGK
jgi:hypothetical protein